MSHQPVTTAPPECTLGDGLDGTVRVIDRGGARQMCPLHVMALIGDTEAVVSVLLDDGEPWVRDNDRTDGSGPDLPDWPEETDR